MDWITSEHIAWGLCLLTFIYGCFSDWLGMNPKYKSNAAVQVIGIILKRIVGKKPQVKP